MLYQDIGQANKDAPCEQRSKYAKLDNVNKVIEELSSSHVVSSCKENGGEE
jgi:hypothetical protein